MTVTRFSNLIMILVAFAAATGVTYASQIDPATASAQDLIEAAEEAVLAGDDATAENLIAAAEKRFPEDPDVAYFHFAWLYYRGKFDAALALATDWLLRHPDDGEYAYTRAKLLMDARRTDEALAAVDEWLSRHPGDQPWLSLKADILFAAGRIDEACALADAQIAADPDALNWLYFKAEVLRDAGRDDEALAALEELATKDKCAEVYFDIAALYAKRPEPDYKKVIAAYEEGLKYVADNLRPTFAAPIYDLARAYARAGKKDQALDLAVEALGYDASLAIIAVRDADLNLLRGTKEFEKALAAATRRAEEEEKQNMTVQPGEKAPAFTLESVEGKKMSLSDFAGKPVVLNIWATWCGPCRREIPELVAFAAAHEGEVAVVSISVDKPGVDLAAFAQAQGINYVILKDDAATATKYLGEGGIPQTYFIDRDGVVRAHLYGSATRPMFEAKLEKVLGAGK